MQNNIPIGSNISSAFIKYRSVGPLVSDVISFFLSVAAVLAFAYLVMGGVLWITSGGDKTKVEEARNRITSAIIGLGIVAASWAVFLLISNFLGLNVVGGASSSSGSNPNTGSSNGEVECGGGDGNDVAIGACVNRQYQKDPYVCLPANVTCVSSGNTYSWPTFCSVESCTIGNN